MADLSPVSGIILFVVLAVFALLYEKGKKKYKDYVAALDKREFALKDIFPVGFALMDVLRYSYSTSIDRKYRKYLKELYDPEYVEFYLRVHWAQAMTYLTLSFFFGALINMALNDPLTGAAVAFGFGTAFLNYSFKGIENKVRKRHMAITMELPELVNKIVVLSGAGLTLQSALFKVATELNGDKILYKELSHTMNMIHSGEPADVAFDHMCVKCNMPEMRRFVAIIIQNIHRGGSDVSHALKSVGDELWTNRKASALRVAEEASTKMLFPMMLMLFAVVILVVAPAIQGMKL